MVLARSSDMSPVSESPGDRKLWPWIRTAGTVLLAYMLPWLVVLWVPGVIRHDLGWPYVVVFYLFGLAGVALIQVWRIHRRGRTIPEALAAGRAERRQRADRRERARPAARALAWLSDGRLTASQSGVLITGANRSLTPA
jgi:hypothetical protein